MQCMMLQSLSRLQGGRAMIRAVNTTDAMTATIEEISYAVR